MVLTQNFCILKPGFIYRFNIKTNFCVKTTQCENTISLNQVTNSKFKANV